MNRLEGTELPTFTLGRKEWNARRAAVALSSHEARTGRTPTLEELRRSLGYRQRSTAWRHLLVAVQLGLVEHSGPYRPRGYYAARGGRTRGSPEPMSSLRPNTHRSPHRSIVPTTPEGAA